MHRLFTRLFAFLAMAVAPGAALAQLTPGDLLVSEFTAGSVVNIRGGGDVSASARFATGLTSPRDLCMGPGNDLYVAEAGAADEVTIITDGGDFTGAAPFATGFSEPVGLMCKFDQILVVEQVSGEVTDITAGGDFTGAPAFATGLGNALDVMRTTGPTLYASEHLGGGRIFDITAGGDFSLEPGFAFNAGGQPRGLANFGGMLLVAEHSLGTVIDFTAGGDLTTAPTFATLTDAENLLDVPGLGLFVTQNTAVFEISAGGDFTAAPAFATGIGNSSGFAGIVYVDGCGDSIVGGGESCDDGNTVDGDGCDASCIAEVCGNGVLQTGEECDDGNTTDGDGCSSACILESCGDGVVQPSEQCDDANTVAGDGCDASCTIEECGNGVLQAGEECDDGNTTEGDGCDASCTAEVCGNGVLQAGEECDDGNTTPDDGCDAGCTIERICPLAPEPGCIGAAKASLSIKENKPGKEKLKASLKKLAAATLPGDFGDPVTGSTVYGVCVYDAADALIATLEVDRAGDVCGPKAKDCWKAAKKGPKYKDQDAASDGVKKITAKSGDAGKGSLKADAGNKANKGQTSLPTGLTAALQGASQATLQVHTDDAQCYGATLTNVSKAEADQFKAKLP